MASAPAFPSNKETTNYARLCRLLVDVGSQVLRDTFDRIHPPTCLYRVLWSPAVHSTLQSLRRKKVLNACQWLKLYPACKAPASSKDFDITLLTVLLRNICRLPGPVTGWDSLPSPTDLTPAADIVRLKHYRNTVYGHVVRASVDDATFNACWSDIRTTLIRLGGSTYEIAIDDLKDGCMDPDTEDHYRELLKQWIRDEDSIKDMLDEVVEKLDELKASLDDPKPSPATLEAELLDVEECRKQLRMHYNTSMSQVRITPWDRDNTVDIDEIYTNLSWMRDVRTPSGITKNDLDDYTEIFIGQGRVANPKRLLVYGNPGIGKSTFSQKIAVDWTNKRKETLRRFDLLLLIKLRDVCGIQTLRDILEASELLPADGSISFDCLYDYVRENQEKVLLVLDGYDEYSTGKMPVVREIWEGKQLRNCYVLVTTRPMECEELAKCSHLQCEIGGFKTKEQVNDFARRFLNGRVEIEEFNSYLSREKLWDLAEIPLLLLMLCLIWKNRYHKELPKSKLALHERFVETLLCHMSLKNPDDAPLNNRDILDQYREEITAIGKLAFDALLKGSVYANINDEVNSQSGSVIDKMIRSGLFHLAKLSSVNPGKTVLFLHKSIQEFLAAWYLMHEAKAEEHRISPVLGIIDSFSGKALKMKEILKFMCEWSVEGAKAAFEILELVGKKDCLIEYTFDKTPSLNNLSLYQGLFRDVALECLISCPSSFRHEVYRLFLDAVGGALSVSNRNIRKVAADHLLRSEFVPNFVFFERVNFPDFVSIVDDLRALVITRSALKLRASVVLGMYEVPELKSDHFFLRKEGDEVYLQFSRICRTLSSPYFQILRDLASALSEASQVEQAVDELSNGQNSNAVESPHRRGNCFSLVREVEVFAMWTNEQLTLTRDLLTAVCFPEDVAMRHVHTDKDAVSYIRFTENLRSLVLDDLQMASQDAAFAVASSLKRAPNLYSLKLTGTRLQANGVRSLGASLRNVPRLSYLVLSEVCIDDQGCSSLATSLKHVPQLTVLDLSKNLLGKGIIELARQLKNVPGLLHLDLEKTNMDEEGATALAQAVEANVSRLRTLQVGCNPLGRGVIAIVQNLSGLSDLRQLDLKDVKMTKNEVDAVSAAQLPGIVIAGFREHQLEEDPAKPESEC